MTVKTDRKGIRPDVALGAPSVTTREPSRTATRWGSAASAVLIVVAGVGLSSPAWAKPKPTIALTNSGSPYVSGSNFTPNGSVVLTEWAVGTKKPISVESESAGGDGTIFFYLNCDGQTKVLFQAKDTTARKKSNRTPPAVLLCVD